MGFCISIIFDQHDISDIDIKCSRGAVSQPVSSGTNMNSKIKTGSNAIKIMHDKSTEDSEFEKSNERIELLTHSSNITDLENKILSCYDTDDESECYDNGLDDLDMSDIEEFNIRRAALETAIKPEMDQELSDEEIDDLEYEFEQQLFELTHQSTIDELNKLYSSRQLTKVYDVNANHVSQSNLYRQRSFHKWCDVSIHQQKEEMMKQILYLTAQKMAL